MPKKLSKRPYPNPWIDNISVPLWPFIMMEARASAALDGIDGIHTCHAECECHAIRAKKLAQTLGNLPSKKKPRRRRIAYGSDY